MPLYNQNGELVSREYLKFPDGVIIKSVMIEYDQIVFFSDDIKKPILRVKREDYPGAGLALEIPNEINWAGSEIPNGINYKSAQ